MSFIESYYNISKDLLYNCFAYLNKQSSQQISMPRFDLNHIATHYSSSPWVKAAAVCGAAAVVMGAYGAHGLKNTDKRAIYDTANRYHFYHSLALLATPFVRRPKLVGTLFLGGITIFSGTCYCNAITDNQTVVRFTPIGGMMFILGWLAMFL